MEDTLVLIDEDLKFEFSSDDDDDDNITVVIENERIQNLTNLYHLPNKNQIEKKVIMHKEGCETLKSIEKFKCQLANTVHKVVYSTEFVDICGPAIMKDEDFEVYKKIRTKWELPSDDSMNYETSKKKEEYINSFNSGIIDFYQNMNMNITPTTKIAFVVFSYVTKCTKNNLIQGPKEMVIVEFEYDETLKKIYKMTDYANVTSSNRCVYGGVEKIIQRVSTVYVYRFECFTTNRAFPWYNLFQEYSYKIKLYKTIDMMLQPVVCIEFDNHSNISCAHCLAFLFIKHIVISFDDCNVKSIDQFDNVKFAFHRNNNCPQFNNRHNPYNNYNVYKNNNYYNKM